MKSTIALLLVISVVSGCTFNTTTTPRAVKLDEQTTVRFNNGVRAKTSVVRTFEAKARGLSGKEGLGQNEGMLFVFEQEDYYGFWMKNTLIPLDILYISENNEIVGIKNNAEPCKEDPCISYKPTKPAKYVLEVNSNFTIKNNIQIGNKIILNKKY